MKIKANLSIGKTTSREEDYVTVRIHDGTNGNSVITLKLDFSQFAQCLLGRSYVKCNAEVFTATVGKKKIAEKRRILYTGKDTYNKESLSKWLQDNCQEEGWKIDSYLGSQSSITYDGDKKYLNYSVYKYIETTEEERMQDNDDDV